MKVFFFSLFILSSAALAQSPAPLNIQDTRTLERGRTDFIFAMGIKSVSDAVTLETPNLDVAVGVLDRLQLRLKTHWNIYFKGAKDGKVGGDNSIFGVKYRFLGDTKDGVSFSVAPQYSYPWAGTSATADPNLAPRDTITLLPIELNLRSSTGNVLFEMGKEKHTAGIGYECRIIGFGFNYIFNSDFEMTFEYYDRLREDNNDKEQIVTLAGKYEFTPRVGVLFSVGQNTAIFTGQEQKYFGFIGARWKFGEAKTVAAPPVVAPAATPTAAPAAAPTTTPAPSATVTPKPAVKPSAVKKK